MTTGTRVQGKNPALGTGPNERVFYKSKGWNGTDGKRTSTGALKENPWTMDAITRSGNANSIGAYYIGGDDTTMAQWGNNETNRLNGRLISKINGHQLQLGIAIGEGRKTIEMVYSNITAISGALVDVKRGDFRSAKRLLALAQPQRKNVTIWSANKADAKFKSKTLANRWLELQYGWLPLLSDVNEGMKAIAVLSDPPRLWKIKTGYNKPKETKTSTMSVSGGTIKWAYKAQVKGRMMHELVENLSVARSLGLMAPEAVAWEIMPWSFVIDWFIPIGTYLTNLNTVPKLTGVTTMTTFRSYYVSGIPQGASNVYKGMLSVTDRVTFNRTVSAGLTSKIPVFVELDNIMSPERFWNALALATQRVTRK